MELVCVRHGRTAWNAARRFQGRTDVPLDDEGRAQAQALAVHLAAERFDLALSSDLSRAAMTAAAIGAAGSAPVRLDIRLREMAFGAWEGLTWDEIVQSTPGLNADARTKPGQYLPAGGESFADVVERVRPLLAEIAGRLAPQGRALIVSHAGIMHALLSVALDEPDESALGITFLPASIMRLTGDGSIPWRLLGVNEVAPSLAAGMPPAGN